MRQKLPELERQKLLTLTQATLWGDEGAVALRYLREERHLSDEVIKEFQYGYCPRDVNHELRGRIIMPLFDPYGKLVIFTTRDPWNKEFSHWHESFDKGRYLYGLNFAKDAIRRNNKAILVEGQFDVGCFHSYGLKMTIGMLGTAFTIMQAIILSRYCSEVYLIFDPDDAGQQSMQRSMQMYRQYCLQDYGIQFFPVLLPPDTDPDDFLVNYGVGSVFEIMKKSKDKVQNE